MGYPSIAMPKRQAKEKTTQKGKDTKTMNPQTDTTHEPHKTQNTQNTHDVHGYMTHTTQIYTQPGGGGVHLSSNHHDGILISVESLRI